MHNKMIFVAVVFLLSVIVLLGVSYIQHIREDREKFAVLLERPDGYVETFTRVFSNCMAMASATVQPGSQTRVNEIIQECRVLSREVSDMMVPALKRLEQQKEKNPPESEDFELQPKKDENHA